jgi:outer membrane receptor protein involved in Fe transport
MMAELRFRPPSTRGNVKGKSPETQGSLSGTYQDQFNEEFDWFTRVDYLHTGSRYATDANLLETGDSNRVNLRLGIENENLRLELYGENLFDDETFTNYQLLLDFAYFGANRIITAGGWAARQAFLGRTCYIHVLTSSDKLLVTSAPGVRSGSRRESF